MAINYNVNPYYDDYDETKQFYRILFRPGRAVQARELTQIQTALQKQIERFGQSIYKEGSIVVPGGLLVDRKLPYANLTASYGTNTSDTVVSSLVGETITGQTSNVKAIVVNYATSTTAGDPTTIYVRYTSSNSYANGVNTTFQAGEVIKTTSGNMTLQIANTSANGLGTLFSVTPGVLFTKGVFAYYDRQNYLVEKYSQANNVILGFQVTESTVEATADTSLLDPAVGASNYIAPGADRYKIALDLTHRPLTVTAVDDPNFIEMVRLEDGEIISKNLDPQYSILGQTLARRTYDESGDYVVNPYGVSVINHLKSANNTFDGYLTAAQGGDDNKLVSIITKGKAYVKGYEIDNLRSRYLIGTKARDYANVNNGVVASTIGNYIYVTNVYSIPDLSLLPTVTFYNQYNSVKGTANGTAVGTGKIRGIQLESGTAGSLTAIYKLWLFDVSMTAGYTFERDVKQLFVDNTGYTDFTCDISPTLILLTGSVTTSNATGGNPYSNVVTGVASRFTDDLVVNDYITIDSVKFKVNTVASASQLTVTPNVVSNLTSVLAYLNTVEYNDNENLVHVFEFPYSTIRNVDTTNLETSYDTFKSYSRSLSANAVTISAGVDETFGGVSASDYILTVKSGANAGQLLNPSTFVTRASGGGSVTIDLSSLANSPANVTAYSTADVALVAKLTKTNTAADKKTKTLVSNATTDFTSAAAAQSSTISLGKADIFALKSVKMANVSFGSAYSTVGEVDITSRYTLDNGQRPTYYGVGSIGLKPNQPKPIGPIRITFDYFTHGTGDYFSISSYSGIDYKDIPTFVHGKKTYQLRDCLDFRPRINDAGTGFTGAGAVVNDFLDPSSDVLTDYSYYLPRIDKIAIDKDSNLKYITGLSSLSPIEPKTPDDSMALFVLSQKSYVFDINQDITIKTIDNTRYTMRDIGRIENRVKNLEYYTALNLLEQDTQSLQIQDSNGFDRFKNGFVVDNFSGHGVGDVFNRDYGVSVDYNNKELRPLIKTINVPLTEINTSTAARTANNYVINDGVITLPYTHVEYIKNQKASTTENINPFSVITWLGKVSLDPPADIWFDEEKLPTIQRNEEGNYDQFLADARAKGTYGSVWGNWESVYYGNSRTDTRKGTSYEVIEQIDTRTDKDVVVNRSVIPKMRSVNINFTGEGLKPNTRMKVFFDNINVTSFCRLEYGTTATGADLFPLAFTKKDANNLITDSTGKIQGVLAYNAGAMNLTTGEKSFRLTDSPTNSSDFETLAEAVFNSSGELKQVRDEIVSVRNANLSVKDILETKTETLSPPPSYDSGYWDPPAAAPKDFYDILYETMVGRTADAGGKAYHIANGDRIAQDYGFSSFSAMLSASSSTNNTGIASNGSVQAFSPTDAGFNSAAQGVYAVVSHFAAGALENSDRNNGTIGGWSASGYASSPQEAATAAANQFTYAVVGYNSGATNVPWAASGAAANDNTINSSPYTGPGAGNPYCPGGAYDPLAQTFFVDGSICLTKVDLFFSAKDSSIPMRIQLRKTVNGVPGPLIIPMSEKFIYPADINISDDGSTATTVNFDAPIFLDAGEYALVLLADSINYRVWISQINQRDVLTNSLISEQPYIGVLFKSQNASTWSPDQYQDLKFTLYRASFSTSVTGVTEFVTSEAAYQNVVLDIDPLEVSSNSNILRVYHPKHGQNTGSSIRVSGWPYTDNITVPANATFYGMNVTNQLNNQIFTIDNVTLDSYTIALPQAVNANVTSITRVGGAGILIQNDFKYDTYYPAISSLTLPGTTLNHKIKTTSAATYAVDSSFTNISINDQNFDTSRVLASNVNRQVSMTNAAPFIHRTEISTVNEFLSPMIDTKKMGGVFVRNLINNPSYGSENFAVANDIITIANATNIVVTQVSGPRGTITFNSTQDKVNAASIIVGSYVNISSNNNINTGQYRVLNVTDNGGNVSVYNISAQNITTDPTAPAGTRYTITNGRNFIAEEAPFDGSAFSKYITREVSFTNPCTAFKFYLDVAKPLNASLEFYYKVSEVGDTTDLKLKEYTKISGVTVPDSLDGAFNEVNKLVDSLPAFDAMVFKIVFLGTDSSQVAKCKDLRVIALA